MDLLIWGHDHGVAPDELAGRVGLEPGNVEVAFREIERRRIATEYLHTPPIIVEPEG
jgi:NAD+ synthase